MNIYLTHKNEQQSAENLDDFRLQMQIKIIAQILSTAVYNKIGLQKDLYKPCQSNKIIEWAQSSKYCILKLIDYAVNLEKEYEYRFDKKHKSFQIILNCKNYLENFNEAGCKDYLSYVGDEQVLKYMVDGFDVDQAYRQLLQTKWYNQFKIPKWTKRNKPNFYKGNVNEDYK